MKNILSLILLLSCFTVFSQFAPPVGQPGSTAIYKDTNIIVQWASGAKLTRGYQDISNTSLGLATVGDSYFALDKAGDNGPVSLGDGGSIVLTFNDEIKNGPGFDFAVFENSFSDDFLELAFVEVSSDGLNFVGFPATSNSDTSIQIASFGTTNATKINNLAGKYRALYGTPFDLEELKNSVGLDVNHITHVKIIDVVGSINNLYASRDQYGHKINDPWPTAFGSSGFDLDAVGVINSSSNSVNEVESPSFLMYPNPAVQADVLMVAGLSGQLQITDVQGKLVYSTRVVESQNTISLSGLDLGMYFVNLESEGKLFTKKLIIK